MHSFLLHLSLSLLTLVAANLDFQYRIPNGHDVIFDDMKWPGVGHVLPHGGGLMDPFEIDFAKAGYTWTVDLCQLDSDRDGLTNGMELGDPNCVWKIGDEPIRSIGITHPGIPQNEKDVDFDCNLEVPDERVLRITLKDYNVPKEKTSYVCTGFELPSEKVYYAVKFRPIITTVNVHHMILYTCNSLQSSDPEDCSNMKEECTSVFFAWAKGGTEFCLPQEVGLVFGSGEAKYVSLQIHYDNPDELDDIVDNSGVEIIYTTIAREFNGGFIQLGAKMDEISIPPRQEQYEVIGVCPEVKTSQLTSPLNVSAYILQMHHIGDKIWTSHYRNGKHIGYIGRNENFNLQTFVKYDSPLIIQPGDRLETHCIYDSSDRVEITYGGDALTDEMCFNYILVYPRIPYNSCVEAYHRPPYLIYALITTAAIILTTAIITRIV